MSWIPQNLTTTSPTHSFLRKTHIAFVPGPLTPLLKEVIDELLRHVRHQGHEVQTTPDDRTDAILTTAPFAQPVSWRKALLLSARRRFRLSRTPTVYTLLHARPEKLQRLLDHFQAALAKDSPDPVDFDFPGLAPQAHRVLFEQGHRGGPILALERLVQAQAKSIRAILVVGDERPLAAYHFDLVGAHPRSKVDGLAAFYEDIVLRLVTTVCSHEVADHQVVGDPIPYHLWQSLTTPAAMRTAARQLGRRNFFTEMVRINDLVHVPAVGDAVAEQYSEGCFATWDPTLEALITTVTGSARPLNKDNITEDDLAVIVGVRPDGQGAQVRHVEGKENVSPSSESVEMMALDRSLPRITLRPPWDIPAQMPVARSKLHGHRGVAAYDPRRVEFVPLAPPYYHYLVSCATDSQARGIEEALAQSEALQNPDDSRQVVFTILPGHGTFIVEKWGVGKAPFQTIWEYMDAGCLQITNRIPQGPFAFIPGPDGTRSLQADWSMWGASASEDTE